MSEKRVDFLDRFMVNSYQKNYDNYSPHASFYKSLGRGRLFPRSFLLGRPVIIYSVEVL